MIRRLALAGLVLVVSSNASAITVDPYGFIRAVMTASSRALDSFGNANLSAPVKALPGDEPGRSSFQLSQTRLGLRINEKERVNGVVEIDFIDFAKATPVTSAVPRLRIAKLGYRLSDTSIIEIGQDWDVFSPGKPATYNYVGLFFNAGNAGFMRPQLKYKNEFGKVHTELALGLAETKNPTPTDSDTEKNLFPSLAGSAAYKMTAATQFGVSAIGGRLRFSNRTYGSFYGLNAFASTEPWDGGALSAEVYFGQNLGNTGALTLATVTGGALHEYGGYLTLTQKLGDMWKTIAGVGHAQITEDDLPATMTRANTKASLALAYLPVAGLEVFAEGTYFATKYASTVTAEMMDLGAVYTF